jgi:hypothetical protein
VRVADQPDDVEHAAEGQEAGKQPQRLVRRLDGVGDDAEEGEREIWVRAAQQVGGSASPSRMIRSCRQPASSTDCSVAI